MRYRTDLIDEEVASELIKEQKLSEEALDIKVVELDEELAKTYKRKPGLYTTINSMGIIIGDIELEEKITKELTKMIKKSVEYYGLEEVKKIFVVGLGNKYVTPDAVGPLALDNILVTNHLDDYEVKIATLSPGVMGQTGMESASIVKSIVKAYKPDLVIAIDALASRSTKRLFKSIQLATSGIAPGSGVKNHRKELSKDTLGCNVLAIGIPTVVDMISILSDYDIDDELEDNLFLTSKAVDDEVRAVSIIISKAINQAFLNLI